MKERNELPEKTQKQKYKTKYTDLVHIHHSRDNYTVSPFPLQGHPVLLQLQCCAVLPHLVAAFEADTSRLR